MKNRIVAEVLNTIADLEEIRGEEAFKAGSYRKAASHIFKMSEDIAQVAEQGRLAELPGVGKNIAAKIRDIIETGTTSRLESLLQQIPPELLDLLKIPGLGPRTAQRLYRELGVRGLADFESALRGGKVAALKGFGDKKAKVLLSGIDELRSRDNRYLLSYAWPVALELVRYIKECVPEARAEIAGSVRRMKETVKDIDIVAAVSKPKLETLRECFVSSNGVSEVTAIGDTKCSVRLDGGMSVDLRIVAPEQYATALHHFTGSKEHHVQLRALAKQMGYRINEYAVLCEETRHSTTVESEEDIYSLLDMQYIPPEMREATGEIELARLYELPELLETQHIQGDLHTHTHWSDGLDSVADMALRAKQRGYGYIAVTDHSKALAFAGGLDTARLRQQAELIDRLNEQMEGFRILKGIEVDILAEGELDLPDEVLSECDVVVASIHSGHRQDEQRIMRRIEAACRNPHVDIIGHLTGRIIGHRSAYPVDEARVLKVAKETNTALEINSSPDRLDISDSIARRARDLGVKCTISTDAHSKRGLDDLVYGVGTARRAWLRPGDVLNSLRLEELLSYLGR